MHHVGVAWTESWTASARATWIAHISCYGHGTQGKILGGIPERATGAGPILNVAILQVSI